MKPEQPESKPGPRRRSDAARNRAAILAAAAAERGRGEQLTLQRLATAAGVSRSTLHRHFRSRSALLAALRDDALAEIRRTVETALAEEATPLSALRKLTLSLVAVGD